MSDQKRILIVEDTDENIVYLSQILEDHGYRYEVAKNGKEAMAMLQESTPDMVLLDIMMPRKSGLAVFKEMKSDPRLEAIPIIVITGASQVTGVDMSTGEVKPQESEHDEFARLFGTNLHGKMKSITPDGYIEKPVEPRLLVDKMADLLR